MNPKDKAGPDTPSSDYVAMQPHWYKVKTVLAGLDALKAAGTTFLPQYEDEPQARYDFRLATAKLTNIYWDIVDNLSRRPFANPVTLKEETADDLARTLEKNVDNRGTDMHTFAQEMFFDGINNAIDWILVDYPKTDVDPNAPRRSVADEEAAGLRPYWRRYSADEVIAVYSDFQPNGEEVLTHIRMLEWEKQVVDFKEVKIKRVRQFERLKNDKDGTFGPPQYILWEERKKEHSDEKEWVMIEGPKTLTIPVIPMVPFITGQRVNKKGWRFNPPMKSALDLQIDHYQQESGLKNVKGLACYPMLAGNKVHPEIDENDKPVPLTVGPQAVLYAPEGQWSILEPGATSMTFLSNDIKNTAKEIRELGRQPLTAQSGNLTVITTAFAAEKGNSAIQNWALAMRYTLERAWELTNLWMKSDRVVEVNVSLNFDTSYGEDQSFSSVVELGTGDDPVISREWVIHEGKRRGILDPDWDEEEDMDKLLKQVAGDPAEESDDSTDEGGRPEGEEENETQDD